jgi:hypothetical protein
MIREQLGISPNSASKYSFRSNLKQPNGLELSRR